MDPADVEVRLEVDDDGVSKCLGAFPVRARVIHMCPTKLTLALRVYHIARPHPVKPCSSLRATLGGRPLRRRAFHCTNLYRG